ncbi:thioesterase family protein [Croceitalea sp. MTPC9]|uniref:acyl-CoA thioesterase n=1 Tax=unclassified Croceitalea TaxID=2632280 RepID=UPI002B38C42D|nr:thioesterase family protein [Croceitalea sp. MTPC6]GMN15525.1 thioesterase family protein [Croceitalea sp. MTPC9]
MNFYGLVKKVVQSDLDDLDHVNNVIYVNWIQEISKKHWQEASKDLSLECIWVVRRHDITYYNAAKLDDEVLVTTTIKDTKGPISYRQVEIKNNKTGKLFVKSVTEWCLLNSKTLKPMRISDKIKNLFQDS